MIAVESMTLNGVAWITSMLEVEGKCLVVGAETKLLGLRGV